MNWNWTVTIGLRLSSYLCSSWDLRGGGTTPQMPLSCQKRQMPLTVRIHSSYSVIVIQQYFQILHSPGMDPNNPLILQSKGSKSGGGKCSRTNQFPLPTSPSAQYSMFSSSFPNPVPEVMNRVLIFITINSSCCSPYLMSYQRPSGRAAGTNTLLALDKRLLYLSSEVS